MLYKDIPAFTTALSKGVTFKIVEYTTHGAKITILYTKVYNERIYSSRDVWEKHPRGECYIFFDETLVHTVHGHRKFGYAEDVSKFGDKSSVNRWFAITKENGENAKVSAFSHEGRRYWVVCSKFTPILFEDGSVPEGTTIEAQIASIWNRQLASLPKKERLLDYLISSGNILIGEVIMASQEHICHYDVKDLILFFAIIQVGKDDLSMHPLDAYTLFECLALPRASMREIKMSDMAAYLQAVAHYDNSEGDVLYGVNAAGIVCYMEKVKAYFYVLERIFRCILIEKTTMPTREMIEDRFLSKDPKKPDPAEAVHYFSDWTKQRLPFLQFFAADCLSKSLIQDDNHWAFQCKWLTLQAACKSSFDTLSSTEIQDVIIPYMPLGPSEADLRALCYTYAALTVLLPSLPPLPLGTKKMQNAFHVTLQFFKGGRVGDSWKIVEYLRSLSGEIDLTIHQIVWNNDVMAAAVRLPEGIPCGNKYAHITLAVAPGKKPFQSNTLLESFATFAGPLIPGRQNFVVLPSGASVGVIPGLSIPLKGTIHFQPSDLPATTSSTNSSSSAASNSSSSSRVSCAFKPKPYKVIVFRGPSGSGKSTTAYELKKYLESLGITVALFETDTCPDIPAAINGLKTSPPQVILITGVGEKKFCSVDRDLEVWFTHSSGYGSKDHVEYLVKRVNTRGEDHPSFTPEKLKGKTSVKAGITSQLEHHPLPTGAFTVNETTDTLPVIKMELAKLGLPL